MLLPLPVQLLTLLLNSTGSTVRHRERLTRLSPDSGRSVTMLQSQVTSKLGDMPLLPKPSSVKTDRFNSPLTKLLYPSRLKLLPMPVSVTQPHLRHLEVRLISQKAFSLIPTTTVVLQPAIRLQVN